MITHFVHNHYYKIYKVFISFTLFVYLIFFYFNDDYIMIYIFLDLDILCLSVGKAYPYNKSIFLSLDGNNSITLNLSFHFLLDKLCKVELGRLSGTLF